MLLLPTVHAAHHHSLSAVAAFYSHIMYRTFMVYDHLMAGTTVLWLYVCRDSLPAGVDVTGIVLQRSEVLVIAI